MNVWSALLIAIAATGFTPITFTIAVAEETFPFLSVTVRTTVLLPRFEQSKLDLSIARDWIPHASLLPLSIEAAVIVAEPLTRVTLIFLAKAIGAMLSSTVTVAVA